jgi:predicted GTPase
MSEKRIAAIAKRDLAMAATPINLRRILDVRHPMDRVRYKLQIIGQPTPKKNLAQRFG